MPLSVLVGTEGHLFTASYLRHSAAQNMTKPLFWAYIMYACLLNCNMDALLLLMLEFSVCLQFRFGLFFICDFFHSDMTRETFFLGRGLIYVWYFSSSFITCANYNTMYVWKLWQSFAFGSLISIRLDVFLRFFALIICLTCENWTILKQKLCEAVAAFKIRI